MQKATNKLRAPFPYFGGKTLLASKIFDSLKDYDLSHIAYVEVFGGSAGLLFQKVPSKVEIYNDIDESVVNFFRVLKDPHKFKKFYRMVSLTLYSRAEFEACQNYTEGTDIERAYKYYIRIKQIFSGKLESNSWGYGVHRNQAHHYFNSIKLLPEIYKRWQNVQVECADFRKIFERYDSKDTLFYCDPPYVPATRRQGGYNCEMTDQDHYDLVKILLTLQGKVILSGYQNEIYKLLEENNWERIDIETVCYAAGRTRSSGLQGMGKVKEQQKRVESLWLSPNITKNILLK